MNQTRPVWCLGLYASGSTWLYNIVLRLAALLHPELQVVAAYLAEGHAPQALAEPGRLLVVKSHAPSGDIWDWMNHQDPRILLTLRDPRDSIASMMVYQGYGFTSALSAVVQSAKFCASILDNAKAALLRYEAGFIDDPRTLDFVATKLGGTLPPDIAAEVFVASRRAATEKVIRQALGGPGVIHHQASGDIVDPTTQWHIHHLGRSGHAGRWRYVLTLPQAAAAESALAEPMARMGYSVEWIRASKSQMGERAARAPM